MTTTKILMLAAFTALSFGMGTAMAQEAGVFNEVAPNFVVPSLIAAPQARATGAAEVQAGSSDEEPMHSGATRAPINWLVQPVFGAGQG